MTTIVKYQISTYSGEIKVNCNENDDNEFIIAKAKRIIKQRAGGSIPFGYQSWKIIDKR